MSDGPPVNEVVLYSPGFSVTIKSTASLGDILSDAERVFKENVPRSPQSAPTGFAGVERQPGFTAVPSSMPLPPQVTS